MRIACGWCGRATGGVPPCGHCGRDPWLPWTQRGLDAPQQAEHAPGRPTLDEEDVRRTYREAHAALVAEGKQPTVEAIAERLDRAPRTVREWRKKFAL